MKMMRRLALLFSILSCFCLSSIAFAEIIELPGRPEMILKEGDTIHLPICISNEIVVNLSEDGKSHANVWSIDFQCYELTLENELIPCTLGCIDAFFEKTETQYGYYTGAKSLYGRVGKDENQNTMFFQEETGEVYRWTPSEGSPYQYVTTVDLHAVHLTDRFSFVKVEDLIYFMVDDDAAKQQTLYAYNITTGQTTIPYTANATGVTSFDYVGNHQMFFEEGMQEVLYNLDTGEMEKCHSNSFNGSHFGMMSDGEDGWYYVGIMGLCHMSHKWNSKNVFIPANGGVCMDLMYRDATNDFIFQSYINMKAYYLCIIPRDGKETEELKIIGQTGLFEMDVYDVNIPTDFMQKHNKLRLNMQSEYSFDDLAQQLVLQGDTFDVMMLPVATDDVSRLLQKGYFYDLSGNDTLVAYVNSLYPAYRDECMVDGRVAAVPLYASCGVWARNVALWEELGIDDVPTTYGELLTLIEQWMDDGTLDEYPLRYDNGSRFSTFSFLMSGLIDQYISAKEQKGEELVFQNDAFMAQLEQLNALRTRLNDLDARHVTGEALLMADMPVAMVKMGMTYDRETYQPLMLGIESAEDATASVWLVVALVNPYSKNVKLAEDFLVSIAEQPSATMRVVLTTEQPAGIVSPIVGTRNVAQEYEYQMADLQAQYEAARKDGDVENMNRAEDAMEMLRRNHNSIDYLVTPEAAATYYAITPYVTVMHSDGYGFVNEQGAELLSAFEAGQIDVKTLVRRLDQLLTMKRMEEQ